MKSVKIISNFFITLISFFSISYPQIEIITGSISMIAPLNVSGVQGTTFVIQIKVGEPISVYNFLGASFNLTFDNASYIEAISTSAGSFLGSNPIILSQNFSGKIEVGVTSTTGGKNGSGVIAICTLRVKQTISGSIAVSFNINNITAIDGNGNSITLIPFNNPLIIPVGILSVNDIKQSQYFDLCQNYPNPFNSYTSIRYIIPHNQFVSLKVYNILGEELASLVNDIKLPGSYEILFDGSNLTSGLYVYSLYLGEQSLTRKFIIKK